MQWFEFLAQAYFSYILYLVQPYYRYILFDILASCQNQREIYRIIFVLQILDIDRDRKSIRYGDRELDIGAQSTYIFRLYNDTKNLHIFIILYEEHTLNHCFILKLTHFNNTFTLILIVFNSHSDSDSLSI